MNKNTVKTLSVHLLIALVLASIGLRIMPVAAANTQLSISADAASQLESVADYTFTVALTHYAGSPVTVDVNVLAGGTATAGEDYQPFTTETLTFDTNSTQKVTVKIVDDTIYENSENFTVELSNASDGTNQIDILTAQAVGSITDNDSKPVVRISDVSLTEGNSGFTVYDFAVTLNGATEVYPVTAAFQAVDGTATLSDSDYASSTGTLTFNAGETSKDIYVSVYADTKYEVDENFKVHLTSITNATNDGDGTGTITNDDSQPKVSISSTTPSKNEGSSGATGFNVTISLSNPSYQTVTVSYATADGTATTADADYVAVPATMVSISAGQTSAARTINANGDTKFEPNETFSVMLSNPGNATLDPQAGSTMLTILNDDAQPSVSISSPSSPYSKLEGSGGGTQNFDFTLSLSNPSYQEVTAKYKTVVIPGGATAGEDFVAVDTTATFPANSTTPISVSIQVVKDDTQEADETFMFSLYESANATVDGSKNFVMATIQNDDVSSIQLGDSKGSVLIEPLLTTRTTLATSTAGTNEFYVRLQTKPSGSASVNIALSIAPGANPNIPSGEITTPGSLTLTFDGSNWNNWQKVVVTGQQAPLSYMGDVSYKVQLVSTSSDTNYNKTLQVSFINKDNIPRAYVPAISRPEDPPAVYFSDDFSTSKGWQTVTYAGGSMAVTNGQLVMKQTVNNNNVRGIAPVSAAAITGIYEIDVDLVSVSPNGSAYGIIFDYKDQDHFNRFLIVPSTGDYSLQKYTGGYVDLAKGTSAAIIKGTNTVRLVRYKSGGNYGVRVYLNGSSTALFDVLDSTYTNGQVGLVFRASLPSGGTAEAHFDNFYVKQVK